MSKEEILENNIIIAEFMGWIKTEIKHEYYNKNDNWVDIGVLNARSFSYNHDWNWLMEVVEKIESLKCPIYISGNNCQIYERIGWGEHIGWHIDSYGKNKLEATYLAIIKFIKWYNQNKLNETN